MKILLATDGKSHSQKAVDFAIDYAKAKNDALLIIFVASPKESESREKLISLGMSALESAKIQAEEGGVSASILLEAGSPYETILSIAEREKVSMIVVGSSGKAVMDRVLIGSVSEYVVRNAQCTVVVVK